MTATFRDGSATFVEVMTIAMHFSQPRRSRDPKSGTRCVFVDFTSAALYCAVVTSGRGGGNCDALLGTAELRQRHRARRARRGVIFMPTGYGAAGQTEGTD